jgi:hypothetical protein
VLKLSGLKLGYFVRDVLLDGAQTVSAQDLRLRRWTAHMNHGRCRICRTQHRNNPDGSNAASIDRTIPPQHALPHPTWLISAQQVAEHLFNQAISFAPGWGGATISMFFSSRIRSKAKRRYLGICSWSRLPVAGRAADPSVSLGSALKLAFRKPYSDGCPKRTKHTHDTRGHITQISPVAHNPGAFFRTQFSTNYGNYGGNMTPSDAKHIIHEEINSYLECI